MARKTVSDLQGLSRLLTEATIGVTEVVEAMHQRIVHPPLLPSTPIQKLITRIAGITYHQVKRTTQLVGNGLDQALGHLAPLLREEASSPRRDALVAALNGVVGDHLEAQANPLRIRMQFRHQGQKLALNPESLAQTYPALSSKILVLVHGSSLSDRQWLRKEHDHGLALAQALDLSPVYLHYNSGRAIAANGQDFSDLLEGLVRAWPVPVTELLVLGHSMGGLVSRSALYYGQQQHKSWIEHLQKMVFLGTPHQGASLERIGSYLDLVLTAIPYTRPLARLGKIRSAGVTDLRYGTIRAEDREVPRGLTIPQDPRSAVPLPLDVACYSIAAVRGEATAKRSSRNKGDGLVSVRSALGQHRDPAKHLHFPESHTHIAYGNSHLDLLNDPDVYAKVKSWLEMA
jgi:pimeloyl-ACP methyl ester carboxylesterase